MSTADIARELHGRGYAPLPMPAGKKWPPPQGMTGYDGHDMSSAEVDLEDWSGNIAVRMSDGLIGLDVDVYHGGGSTLAEWEATHGPLPATTMSTARTDGSGIRLFRVPAGTMLATQIEPGIEVCQWFHRYVMCSPSTNPDHEDRPYHWIDQASGEILDLPPEAHELPELPWSWLEAMTIVGKGRKAERIATPSEVQDFIDRHDSGTHRGALQGPRKRLNACSSEQWGQVKGGRHDTAMKVACWMLRESRAGLYPAHDAINLLRAWWHRVDKPDDELDGILLWAVAEAEAESAERIEDIRTAAAEHAAQAAESGLPESWVERAVLALFADEMSSDWAYVVERKQWLRWDGRRWGIAYDVQVAERARQWVGELLQRVFDADGDEKALKGAIKFQRSSAWNALAKDARGWLAIGAEELDRHPHLLNTPTGIVNLRTGKMAAHEPSLLITKITAADYDPDAEHEDLELALECVDDEVRNSLQELFGISATGYPGADSIAVFDGQGSNGKTTVLLAVDGALGGFGSKLPADLVVGTRDEHPAILMTLRGLRMGYVEELAEDGSMRMERLKDLSGGGTVRGRVMRGDWEEFPLTHTLVIATNHRPNVNTNERSVWRRLKLVPFPYSYGDEEGDRPIDIGLRHRIQHGDAQQRATLAWLVRGAMRAFAAGGDDSPTVRWATDILEATTTWRNSEDVIGNFLRAEVVMDPDARVRRSAIYAAYESWCRAEGRMAKSAKNFIKAFEDHPEYGFNMLDTRPSDGYPTIFGLRLKTLRDLSDQGLS